MLYRPVQRRLALLSLLGLRGRMTLAPKIGTRVLPSTALALVFIATQVLLHFWFNVDRLSCAPLAALPKLTLQNYEPGNSATGTLFMGEEMRKYTGAMLFASGAATDSLGPPPAPMDGVSPCDKWRWACLALCSFAVIY